MTANYVWSGLSHTVTLPIPEMITSTDGSLLTSSGLCTHLGPQRYTFGNYVYGFSHSDKLPHNENVRNGFRGNGYLSEHVQAPQEVQQNGLMKGRFGLPWYVILITVSDRLSTAAEHHPPPRSEGLSWYQNFHLKGEFSSVVEKTKPNKEMGL